MYVVYFTVTVAVTDTVTVLYCLVLAFLFFIIQSSKLKGNYY
ncbi:hypothetical protein DFA_07978 [Cavenderia fasciculata]|uniref:Uncharacterized protein n=1 Tax=Cavenderia fasciculata TaxID=261658 RepID=F4Q4D5_CACFS|nr:uncharacterized protein DFA_07978 [Cavenderia fasciculata]EGG16997.1 hypothetical protein DFA_07978 [Cavenderia fasciculata]|eukprot:XP_004355481.1 hypothetical protein DFA_07978 [Cavenderia fasciculata]